MATYRLKEEDRMAENDEFKTIEIIIPQVKPADVIEETTPAGLKEEIVRMEEERDREFARTNAEIDKKKAYLAGIKKDLGLNIE